MADRTKHLILIHGRNFKPNKSDLEDLWLETIRAGLERDNGNVTAFENVKKTLVYYGDLSETELGKYENYDEQADIKDRENCLDELKKYKASDFDETTYHSLPGASLWKEEFADIFGGLLDRFRFTWPLSFLVTRDVAAYWKNTDFGESVRNRLTSVLGQALEDKDDIMLVGHSLGTMIAWDVLWSFYQEQESNPKINTLVTLGSPLGNATVQKHLRAKPKEASKLLTGRWENIAARGDYICYNENLNNDFPVCIRDHRICNLAVRKDKSNPCHGAGYLIHPTFICLCTDWLST